MGVEVGMQKPLGLVRLDALGAPDVWHAMSTLTQHALGPRSIVTVRLAAAALRRGDVAGLALFERPYAWIGVERRAGFHLSQFDERTGRTHSIPLDTPRLWLRVECDFAGGTAAFSFSKDGARHTPVGEPYSLGPRAMASQSIPCSLFSCSIAGDGKGGHADFDTFLVSTPTR